MPANVQVFGDNCVRNPGILRHLVTKGSSYSDAGDANDSGDNGGCGGGEKGHNKGWKIRLREYI